MNLSFESLDDLKNFLAFAGYAKKTTGEIAVDLRVSDEQHASIVTLAAAQLEGTVAADAPPGLDVADPTAVTDQAGGEPADAPPVKRGRRTKAEIAAAAAHAVAAAAARADYAVAAAAVAAHADYAKKTTREITVDLQLEPESKSDQGPTASPSDIEHLRLCREFIATQGMAKYEQSFPMAGIEGKNIMAFTDADRAKHVAALHQLATQ